MVDALTVGYGLIILGVLMLIAEAMVPGFFIAVPATILVILGAFALVTPDFALFAAYAPLIVLGVGVPATAITIWVYRRMAPPAEVPTTRAADTLLGAEGIVTVDVTPDTPRGKVKIQHEMWSAVTRGAAIPKDQRVRVTAVEGVILVVERAS